MNNLFNKTSQREQVASKMNFYAKDNPRSGHLIRDRFHSPYKEHIEAQFTDEDIKQYDIQIKHKPILEGAEARACAKRWKEVVLNEA